MSCGGMDPGKCQLIGNNAFSWLTVCCWYCIQIQKLGHPFHRMFTLDNRAIQYPFAVTERVSVS